MSDGQVDVPGNSVGRPMNSAAEQPQAADGQTPVNTQTPGDYFVGRPENLRQQEQAQATAAAQPAADPNRSSFLAKWCACLAGSGATS